MTIRFAHRKIEVDDEEYLKATVDKGYVSVGLGLTGDEEAAVAKMMGGGGERRTLADIIMDKINEKQNEIRDNMEGAEEEEEVNPFPEKVVTVYTDIGNILSRYTAGKLPKAFKVIPSLTEWEVRQTARSAATLLGPDDKYPNN